MIGLGDRVNKITLYNDLAFLRAMHLPSLLPLLDTNRNQCKEAKNRFRETSETSGRRWDVCVPMRIEKCPIAASFLTNIVHLPKFQKDFVL